jgi:predicted membrane metal-binding protein
MPEWVGFVAWAALALGGLATYFLEDDDEVNGEEPESIAAGLRGLVLPLLALGLGILFVALMIGNSVGAVIALVMVAVLLSLEALYFVRLMISRRVRRE